jgi:hypothetical protein
MKKFINKYLQNNQNLIILNKIVPLKNILYRIL